MKKKLIPLIVLFVFTFELSAQWKQSNGPNGGLSRALLFNGSDIIAGTSGSGIFISTNGGQTWKPSNKGLSNFTIGALAKSGNFIFAGTDGGGAFVSSDNGATWTRASAGLTDQYVRALVTTSSKVFAGTGSGVFMSDNNGTSWNKVSNGLLTLDTRSLVVQDSFIYAGTYGGGIFKSGLNNNNWNAVNNGVSSNYVYSMAYADSTLYAASGNKGVFISTTQGASWTVSNAADNGLENDMTRCVMAFGNKVFAGTTKGLSFSTNKGTTWTSINSGIMNKDVLSLAYNGTSIFAGTNDGGIFVSTNTGASWSLSGVQNTSVTSFVMNGSNVFAGTYGNYSIHLTTNKGDTWKPLVNGFLNVYEIRAVNALANIDSVLFSGTDGGGVFRSLDFGKTWSTCDSGFVNPQLYCFAFLTVGSKVYAGTNYGVYEIDKNGVKWNDLSAGLPSNTQIISLAIKGNLVFAGTKDKGLFIFNTNTGIWSPANTGLNEKNVYSIVVNGNTLFLGTNSGIFQSTNDGASWSLITGTQFVYFYALVASGNMMFAGSNLGTYVSKDNGSTWKFDVTGIDGLENKIIKALIVNDNTVYAGTSSGGVWTRSVNDFNTGLNAEKVTPFQVVVYPNPFSTELTFLKENRIKDEVITIVIFDLNGKQVAKKIFREGEPLVFDLMTLNAGMYFYHCMNKEKLIQTGKIYCR